MGPRVAFDVPAVVDGLASAPTIRVAMDPLSASRSVTLFASPLRTPELIAPRLGCDDGVGAPAQPSSPALVARARRGPGDGQTQCGSGPNPVHRCTLHIATAAASRATVSYGPSVRGPSRAASHTRPSISLHSVKNLALPSCECQVRKLHREPRAGVRAKPLSNRHMVGALNGRLDTTFRPVRDRVRVRR